MGISAKKKEQLDREHLMRMDSLEKGFIAGFNWCKKYPAARAEGAWEDYVMDRLAAGFAEVATYKDEG